MPKDLILRDNIYPYPDQGDTNYAEAATDWAAEATDILGTVSGPGDIATTEVTLTGTDTGTHIEGDITNLVFDTSYVQRLEVTGFITRTFTDATPDKVESFVIEGSYNRTDINFSVRFDGGDDTEFDFTISGGQFGFSYLKIINTDEVKIKFSAKATIDESLFA